MKVRGYIYIFWPLEFDLEKNTVYAVKDHWAWKYFEWMLDHDEHGWLHVKSVKVHDHDPGVLQDCMRILGWENDRHDKLMKKPD